MSGGKENKEEKIVREGGEKRTKGRREQSEG